MVIIDAFFFKAYATPDKIRACSMSRVRRIALVNVTETRFMAMRVGGGRC